LRRDGVKLIFQGGVPQGSSIGERDMDLE
jgi:hypothetical protein